MVAEQILMDEEKTFREMMNVELYQLLIELDVDRFLSLWSFVIYLVVMIEGYYARHVNVDTWYAPTDYLQESLI